MTIRTDVRSPGSPVVIWSEVPQWQVAAHGGFNNAPVPRLPHTQHTMCTVHNIDGCWDRWDNGISESILIITNTIDQISSLSASYLSQQVLLIFLAELSPHLSSPSAQYHRWLVMMLMMWWALPSWDNMTPERGEVRMMQWYTLHEGSDQETGAPSQGMLAPGVTASGSHVSHINVHWLRWWWFWFIYS